MFEISFLSFKLAWYLFLIVQDFIRNQPISWPTDNSYFPPTSSSLDMFNDVGIGYDNNANVIESRWRGKTLPSEECFTWMYVNSTLCWFSPIFTPRLPLTARSYTFLVRFCRPLCVGAIFRLLENRECRDRESNPGLLGVKRECYLCASRPPSTFLHLYGPMCTPRLWM